jgi:MSHA pilin protein MshD
MRSKDRAGYFAGFTLLEVLVTIVVLSLAATAIMGVYIATVRSSADPLLQQQAISIAQAYLEEIQLKAFADPTQVETGGSESGETRASFDDVQDYDGLNDTGARDQDNTAIPALAAYSVQVSVNPRSLSGGSTIPASDSLCIDVTVSHNAIGSIVLSGFRTNY